MGLVARVDGGRELMLFGGEEELMVVMEGETGIPNSLSFFESPFSAAPTINF